MIHLPVGFREMLSELLGEESSELIEALNEKPVTSVRLNKRKPGASFPGSEKVSWCESGLYLSKRPEFIFDPLLHAGAYYVQDASSMIYETLISSLVATIAHETREEVISLKVLDLCAAPGGKTTAMINALPDDSFVTANEYSRKRVGALKENLDKWGFRNFIVTNKDSGFYASQGESYDIVAVDAPCSGEGMMRKEEMARIQWSPKLVEQCAILQKEILSNAVKALKPGGFFIYSTCTFNREENENNAEFIVNELGMDIFDPAFPVDWGIPRGIKTDLPVYRFMPHKTKGEGLFLAVFRKPGILEPSKSPNKNKNFSSLKKEEGSFPIVEVDEPTALAYLRGESLVLPEEAPRGMVTISYKGFGLGPAKNIGQRANNHYPKERRILKR